ncbi:5991_t:CDS:10, partial [Racocetra persica]
TVENKEEIIKNSVNHIWKATEGKVVTITFNNLLNSVTITLNNSNKTILNLDAPGVVLINEEIFRNIVNVVDGSNRKEPITIDKVEIRLQESATQSSSFEMEEDCTNKKSSSLDDSEASVSVDQTLNYKESNDNAIGKDRENEIQGLDSVAQPLNYEESDKQSFNAIEKDQKNETQDLNSSIQEYDNPQSDEYYDSTEEADEQRFNEITKSNSDDKYKFQINNQFKDSKNKIEKNNSKIGKVDKANDEPVNNFIERVPSNLTEDFLPSVNEIFYTYEMENDIRQYPYILIESVDTNSLSTNIMEQTSNSFPTATANTEFLSADLDEHESTSCEIDKLIFDILDSRQQVIECVPSDLTDNDSLLSISEIMITIINDNYPSNETNISHPDIVNVETSTDTV